VSENKPIRVFVTHAFDEGDDYLRVFEFLESIDRFFYLNVSKPENVPSEGTPEAIKDELIAQIKASEAVIVLPSAFEQDPDLVIYMMDVADANKIGMITIRPFGGILETPKKVIERVGQPIDWNAREIVDSLRLTARGQDTQRWEVVDFPGFGPDGET
jgi:hypothetical protein